MRDRRPLLRLMVALALGATAPACLLDASAYDTGTGGPGTTGTTGTGATSTGTAGTGNAGASTTSGTGATGGTGTTGGTGGTGGSPIEGDGCPGIPTSIAAYAMLTIQGDDTSGFGDDYASYACGGGDAPEVVYAVTALAGGYLTATLTPDEPYNGFLHIRKVCEDVDSQVKCSDFPITFQVQKDQVVYIFVDGHADNPTGTYTLQLYLDACGDGVIQSPEECDDQNGVNGDGCEKCLVKCDCPGGCNVNQEAVKNAASKHCYLQVYSNLTWQEARIACQAWGGDLAALSTQAEIDAMSQLIGNNIENCWIGGSDELVDGTFAWTNGEPWTFTNGQSPWDSGEPNGNTSENCVEIYGSTKINDEHCDYANNYLCERAPAGVPDN